MNNNSRIVDIARYCGVSRASATKISALGAGWFYGWCFRYEWICQIELKCVFFLRVQTRSIYFCCSRSAEFVDVELAWNLKWTLINGPPGIFAFYSTLCYFTSKLFTFPIVGIQSFIYFIPLGNISSFVQIQITY